MGAREWLGGTADGPFERIACGLVLEGGLELLGTTVDPEAGVTALVGTLPGGGVVALLRCGPDALEVGARIAQGQREPELVLVGGDAEDGDRFAAAVGDYGIAGLRVWQVPDAGPARALTGGAARVAPFLAPLDTPPDWARFWAASDARRAAASAATKGFVAAMQGRRPRATQALVVGIAVLYLVGMAWGAPDLSPALLRMGAFEPDRVRAGEVWRLLSGALLHGSPMHLAFNLFVLWGLGGTLERILGSARFLLLWTVGALGGSLLCLATTDALMVGASGAGWGLMAAELVLALRGRGILPEALRQGMRRGMIQNLVLNVGISFLPGVAWAAHLGGGLAGAALVGSGVLLAGLPRWAEGASEPDRVPTPVQAAGALSGAALALAAGVSLLLGQAWRLDAPVALVRAPVGASGWTAELPGGVPVARADATGAILGDPRADAGAVELVVSGAASDPAQRAEAADALAEMLAGIAAREGAPPVDRSATDDGVLLVLRYPPGDGVSVERAIHVGPAGIADATVAWWTELGGAGWPGLARRVATSATPGP